MRIYAVSDLHLDYAPNRDWLAALPQQAHRDDVLLLAGDLSDRIDLLEAGFAQLVPRFAAVLYVPGNHDLWVRRDDGIDSWQKFERVMQTAKRSGVHTEAFLHGEVGIVPLLSWYDYSFGQPEAYLRRAWSDYRACRWPEGDDDIAVTERFLARNPVARPAAVANAKTLITVSHFLPRIDLMPARIPAQHRRVYPVLGTHKLDAQLRQLSADIHVYGHSHVNRSVRIDGVTYVNNALGYPNEAHFTQRELVQVYPPPQ